jgi:hypothetical protein
VQQLMLIVREDTAFPARAGAVRFVPLLNGPLA